MFEKAKKIVKDSMNYDHDCKNSPDSACQSCYKATQEIEALERDEREIAAALTAIRQFAKDIRHYPNDANGTVDYSSLRIIEIIDSLTGENQHHTISGKKGKNGSNN